MKRYYLGVNYATQTREVFRSESAPTYESHGRSYVAVVGPFRTERGAQFMADYGVNNPHCRNVAEAERLARVQS